MGRQRARRMLSVFRLQVLHLVPTSLYAGKYSIMPVAIRRKTIFLGIHDVKFCRLSNVEEPFTDFWQVHISRRLEGKRGTWVTVIPDQFMTLRTTTAERLNN